MDYSMNEDYTQYAPAPDTLRLYSISQLWQLFTGAVTDIHEVRSSVRKVENQMKMLIVGQTVTLIVMVALLVNSVYHKYMSGNRVHAEPVADGTTQSITHNNNNNNNNNNNTDDGITKLPNIVLSRSSLKKFPLKRQISNSLDTVKRWNQPPSHRGSPDRPEPPKTPVEVII